METLLQSQYYTLELFQIFIFKKVNFGLDPESDPEL